MKSAVLIEDRAALLTALALSLLKTQLNFFHQEGAIRLLLLLLKYCQKERSQMLKCNQPLVEAVVIVVVTELLLVIIIDYLRGTKW